MFVGGGGGVCVCVCGGCLCMCLSLCLWVGELCQCWYMRIFMNSHV